VRLRRLFLLGTAALASLAALVAIAAILTGSFGSTDGKIFATLATVFVAGSTLVAGLALLDRGESRLVALATSALAVVGFAVWTLGIWGDLVDDTYAEVAVAITAWTLALLVTATTRLLLRSAALVRRLYPATTAAALGAAVVTTAMIMRENGDGWQLLAILVVLALLGEILAPVLERLHAADGRPAERLLGVVAGAEVIAVRSAARRVVRVGATSASLAADETIVVRERA
jgi:hypothetical protein